MGSDKCGGAAASHMFFKPIVDQEKTQEAIDAKKAAEAAAAASGGPKKKKKKKKGDDEVEPVYAPCPTAASDIVYTCRAVGTVSKLENCSNRSVPKFKAARFQDHASELLSV